MHLGWLIPDWVGADQDGSSPIRGPAEPLASLELFQLAPGFAIQLVAHEPNVIDPVDLAFDTDGSLWVVEMLDYPRGNGMADAPSGRIRRLWDQDGDGLYDSSQTFLDGLVFPTGIALWEGGALLTVSGKLIYAKDTTGDGIADLVETWVDGFAEENSQLRANHPTLAWNQWLYLANGLRGGQLRVNHSQDGGRTSESAPRMNLSSFDLRLDLRARTIEAMTGVAQFGLTFDDAGIRYVCSNRNPCIEILIEQGAASRSPLAGLVSLTRDCLPFGEDSRVEPLTSAWTTSNLHASQFTAACGVLVARGRHLPDAPYNNVFVCEPTGNLVHHRPLRRENGRCVPIDPGYQGEFVASRDDWFRPVNLKIGPDDALYVIDMYRAVIEHPEWVPDELKYRPDERDGDDRGRIYRITRQGSTDSSAWFENLRRYPLQVRPSSDLVALLDHPHSWFRETASRLVFERGVDDALASSLRRTCQTASSRDGKLRAASLLDRFKLFDSDTLFLVLRDSDPYVRAAVFREGLGLHQELEHGLLLESLITSLRDEEFDVASAAAWCLSNPAAKAIEAVRTSHFTEVHEALVDFLTTHAVDGRAWMAAAGPLSEALPESFAQLLENLAVRYETTRPEALPSFSSVWESIPRLAGKLRSGTKTRDGLVIDGSHLQRWVEEVSADLALPEVSPFEKRLWLACIEGLLATDFSRVVLEDEFLSKRIQELAESKREGSAIRNACVRILGLHSNAATMGTLVALCDDENEETVQLALASRARRRDAQLARYLLDRLPTAFPQQRSEYLALLLSDEGRLGELLMELETGKLPTSALDASFWQQLASSPFNNLRSRINHLLEQRSSSSRAAVLQLYKESLNKEPDLENGRNLFQRNCAGCHRIGGQGFAVGPDISDSRLHVPEQLLVAILDPNRAIDNNYFRYVALTQEGEFVDGILVESTSKSITLRGQNGLTRRLVLEELAEWKATNVSMMPEGLEHQLSVQEMADLIGYIKNWRYLENPTTGTIRAKLR